MKASLRQTVTTWPFLLALATLLANDFWFKRAWPGLVTGKLSDFAGIAIVSLLLFAAFPERRRLASFGIVIGFAWWKSPLSQPAIDAWPFFPIGRTVDYTDLAAFLVMPACAVVARRPVRFALPGAALRRWLAAPLIALTGFALMATSQVNPRPYPPCDTCAPQLPASAPAAPPAPDHAAIERTVREVAARYGLQPDSRIPTLLVGAHLELSYTFGGPRSLGIQIQASPMFLSWKGSVKKRIADLGGELKTRLGTDFKDLEVIERLGREADRP